MKEKDTDSVAEDAADATSSSYMEELLEQKIHDVKQSFHRKDLPRPENPPSHALSLEEAQHRCQQLKRAVEFQQEKAWAAKEESQQYREEYLAKVDETAELTQELLEVKERIDLLDSELDGARKELKAQKLQSKLERDALQKKERQIDELTKKCDETELQLFEVQEELIAIQQQFSHLRQKALNAEEELKWRMDSLQNLQKEFLIVSKRHEQLEEDLASLNEELTTTKKLLESELEDSERKEERLNGLANDKDHWMEQASHYRSVSESLQTEVEELKLRLEESEQRDLQKEEKISLLCASYESSHKEELDGLNEKMAELLQKAEQVPGLEEERTMLIEERDQLRGELEAAYKELSELPGEKNKAHALAQDKAFLQEELASEKKEKANIAADLAKARNHLEDFEQKVKEAHQHLAKKVKENALIAEDAESIKLELMELKKSLHQQISKHSELQGSFDSESKQRQQLETRLEGEQTKAQREIAKWEEKYHFAYEKWQQSDAKCHELQKYEEKYEQVQHFLSGIGIYMDKAEKGGLPKSIWGSAPRKKKEEVKEPEEKKEPPHKQQDLFGSKEKKSPYKDDLFS